MTRADERFKWETASGETATVGDVSVTPQSKALTVRWPNGGWVWNRPVAVLMERGEEKERIPIVDVTRMGQLALYGLSLAFAVIGLIIWIGERRASDE